MPDEQRRKLFLLLAIILISLNLRPAITGVGPLIGEIRLDTGLSSSALGLLTTLPVLAFGIFSVLTSLFTRKLGTEGTMTFALLLLTAGILFRIVPSHWVLFLGTGLLGIGIALGNVLMPGIVKREFPARVGVITGVYSATFGVGAAIASGISVPLSEGAGFGWRWALGIWAILSFMALIAWLPQLRSNLPVISRKGFRESLQQLGRSKLAWMVSLFMGVQSFTFYTLITWLPELLIDRGMSASEAGWMLALMQGVGVIGTFLIPAWCSTRDSQRVPVLILVLLELVSLGGLMIPSASFVGLWVSIMGFCLGGSFGLALLFIILRTRDTGTANELSGMSQSVGYTFAATGPVLFGALFDWTGAWLLPIILLVVIAILKLISGWYAGDQVYVET
ncbi:MAG: MFS transporter [Balneolaceae bacterium]|nr:MFS transporter [Balneolaceae bacterium]